jgi:hypothetical protein
MVFGVIMIQLLKNHEVVQIAHRADFTLYMKSGLFEKRPKTVIVEKGYFILF